ncbi:hypothetical protein [Prochlorococcus sp. MIT 1227]|uniref:hypothetical protein n=1 Tax=Prochlorococcus sp. MIT 1227 TaxID=3082536 RepID=UPI0039A48CC4
MINITAFIETGHNQIDCAERGYVHQEAKASETHQPFKTMINNNLVRNQVKANWEDITRKGEDHAMTFELDNKVPSIHPKATNWLDNNDSNFNFNITKASSLVNGGWKDNYGNQLLDSHLLDPIKNPKIKSSDLVDLDIRIPEINLTQPREVDLIQPIHPDAAFSTDIADRHIGMADAAMERTWGHIMAGISSWDDTTVGHTNTFSNSDGRFESTNTTFGSVELWRNDGEYRFSRHNELWGTNTDITEEEYFAERFEAEAAGNECSTNNSSSSSSSSSSSNQEDDRWWFGKRWGRPNPDGIAPWSETGGRPPWFFIDQSPVNTNNFDSLIKQVDPHLTSEYLLKEIVTTSLDNRIADNLLLQDNNTSAQIEGTDVLTNFNKGLLANSVATSREHSQGFEEPIAADYDVFSFGGMTQSMPLSTADENVLLTVDNVMPQQMLSNNMTTPIEF